MNVNENENNGHSLRVADMRGTPGELVTAPAGGWTDEDYHLTPEAAEALAQAAPANTRAAYKTWWRNADQWCRKHGRTTLPMSSPTLTSWVQALCSTISDRTGRHYSAGTLSQAVAAISALHTLSDHEKPDATKARRLINAHRREQAAAGRTVERSAIVTPDQVITMIEMIEADARTAMTEARRDGTDVATAALPHLRDKLIVIISFLAWPRRSEMSNFLLNDLALTEDGALDIRYRVTKTDQGGEGYIDTLHARTDALDPITAYSDYIAALAHCGVTEGRLLRRIDRWGNVHPSLSGESINDIIKTLTTRAGCATDGFGRHVTAHGMRAAGNSAAKRAGASTEVRRRRGRWAPNSTMPDDLYDRSRGEDNPDPMSQVGAP